MIENLGGSTLQAFNQQALVERIRLETNTLLCGYIAWVALQGPNHPALFCMVQDELFFDWARDPLEWRNGDLFFRVLNSPPKCWIDDIPVYVPFGFGLRYMK